MNNEQKLARCRQLLQQARETQKRRLSLPPPDEEETALLIELMEALNKPQENSKVK